MSGEIRQITSLRGIAALSVVLLHIIGTYPLLPWIAEKPGGSIISFALVYTLVRVVIAGGSAVILFFVLSGFVLALPFVGGNTPSTSSFIARRICRIYIPYAVALIFVLAIRTAVAVHYVPGTTESFGTYWSHAIDARTVIGYLGMTGSSQQIKDTDFVAWSLVHEMRISLLFPVLMIALQSMRSTGTRIATSLLFSTACMCALAQISTSPSASSAVLNAGRSLLDTGHYVWLFVVGIEIARHRRWLLELGNRVHPAFLLTALVISLCLYCAQGEAAPPGVQAISIFLVGFGSAGIVALALMSSRIEALLTVRPCVFLGEISYSLYLIHPVILLGMVHGLDGRIPGWLTLTLVPIVSMVVAWAMRRYVELPSIAVGRRISTMLSGRATSPSRVTAIN